MSVSTRTARKSASTDTTGPAEKAVLAVIAENRKYVGKDVTANNAAFHAFVRNENEGRFTTDAEIAAFDLGLRLSGLKARYQKARSAGTPTDVRIASDVSFADYAIETSGVSVPKSASAKAALVAGIESISRYVAWRNSKPVTTEESVSAE